MMGVGKGPRMWSAGNSAFISVDALDLQRRAPGEKWKYWEAGEIAVSGLIRPGI